MNKYEKEIQQVYLDNEKKVLEDLKQNYQDALDEINGKIEMLMARQDADMQHVIYQVEYQKALRTQVQSILEQLQSNEFETVSEYLAASYEDGFIGTMYNLQGQGVPLVMPLDQEQIVEAIQHETNLSTDLYSAFDIKDLQKKISGEISRGLATGQMFAEIARNISGYARINLNNAMRIARTEGHRIQCKASMDACNKAKSKGADVVKQWDASLDRKTRKSHRKVDGEIRELDEPFSNGLDYPGEPKGKASEVINCRCALLQRASWALGNDFTKWDEEEGIVEIKAKDYNYFKNKYNEEMQRVRSSTQKMNPTNKNGEEIHFDFKGNDEKFSQNKKLITDLANEYDTRLQNVTVGAFKGAGDVDMYGFTMRLNSNEANTTIHEFAHTLANSKTDKLGVTHDEDFWKEVKKIKRQYHKAVDSEQNPSRWISFYEHSSNSVDEFLAEAFTQAKMAQRGMDFEAFGYGSDLTYSNMVLDTVDKYFKKETLENTVKSSTMKSNIVNDAVESGSVSKKINTNKQNRHIKDSADYIEGRSYIAGNLENAQMLVDELSGTGTPIIDSKGNWTNKERVEASETLGVHVNPDNNKATETKKATIIYSKTGSHIVPRKGE